MIRPLQDRRHKWAARLREISLDYEDQDGAPLRRHVATRVMHRAGAWVVLALAYQTWHPEGRWTAPRFRLARVHRHQGGWRAEKFMALSAGTAEALGGGLAEFAVDVQVLLRRADPMDRRTRLPRSRLSYREHQGAEEEVVGYDGP